MGIGAACPRCGSLMLTPSYDDEPMYCLVCGAQGAWPLATSVFRKAHKARVSSTQTARYNSVNNWPGNKKLQHLTVKYRMTFGEQHGPNPMPALIVECPWCGGVTKSQDWMTSRKLVGDTYSERYLYLVCPSEHTYSIICNEDGDYYWR